jgi:rhodanese-related sulfurtransferase
MEQKQDISASTLQNWLEHKENVVVLDVRPKTSEKNGKSQGVFM